MRSPSGSALGRPSRLYPWCCRRALAQLPLHLRKINLARLLARRADGIHLAPFEQGEIGPVLFRAACDMMLEGLVSKRRDSRYRAGPSRAARPKRAFLCSSALTG
jgi:ATP-dependent DNA ligase